jgi:hypothetical protein
MGRIFLEHLGVSKVFVCAKCDTFLTNNNELYSKNTRGVRGSAYLFKKVVNVTYSESTKNNYKHFVRDVFCKKCNINLGFYYEFVPNESIRYLEGKVILEKSTVRQENGIEESKRKHKLSSEDKPDQDYRSSEIIDSDSNSASNSDSEDEGRDETG